MSLAHALNRTLLLMREHLKPEVTDHRLLDALTGTRVVLVADMEVLQTHGAQTSFITAAILMARMGISVSLRAPDALLKGLQPPLMQTSLVSGLMELGKDLLPGIEFSLERPDRIIDLQVLFGGASPNVKAGRTIWLNADDWSANLLEEPCGNWCGTEWPFGGMGAAALAAGEAFKCAMRKLSSWAHNELLYTRLFQPATPVRFEVAPKGSPKTSDLGDFDFVSGGAVSQAALYSLARIPNIKGAARIIENDFGDLTNLNRNMMLRRSRAHLKKAVDLTLFDFGQLKVIPVVKRFIGFPDPDIAEFRPHVLVGVDHIPSRWKVQRAQPRWLGIGATTGFEIMVTFHQPGTPCAGCAHPFDEPQQGSVPTISFVSFWAGLLLASLYVRHAAGQALPATEQYVSFGTLRPDGRILRSALGINEHCPIGHEPMGTAKTA